MKRSLTWTGFLTAIFSLAFAVEAFAEDDTREPEVRGASLALIDDSDGDGIPDAEDNCPEVSNADQSDLDGDGFGDVCDNCLLHINPIQFDCDDDYCGNVCDCDYNQDGRCGIAEWGLMNGSFGRDDPCHDHFEPHGGPVGFADFGFVVANFGGRPGPSGSTPGTVACPIWEP
jgi:hypothetical protein